MREITLTLPEIGMINSTRFIIGTGVGMLLAGAMDDSARRAVGIALLAVGTLVSIPMAVSFLGKLRGRQSLTQQSPERRAA
jgi:hypothetical protein